MKYNITHGGAVPAYLQLYYQLRDDITKGIYPPLSKLPSKRTLAQELGISTITVAHAYELLCDEGYAESRERSGYVVIFRVSDVFAAPAKQSTGPRREFVNLLTAKYSKIRSLGLARPKWSSSKIFLASFKSSTSSVVLFHGMLRSQSK